jgi:hypothetical protein
MAAARDPITGLVVDPALRRAWSGATSNPVSGIAGAVAGSRGSVVVASPAPVDDAAIAAATPGLAGTLGARSVEVVVVTTTALPELLRDWIYQAVQGSGRGVRVTVRTGTTTAPAAGVDTGEGTGASQVGGTDGGSTDRSPGPDGYGDVVPAGVPVRVLVRAIDSSARELVFRLASPQEPALPALRALLGGREVSVEDEESSPTP